MNQLASAQRRAHGLSACDGAAEPCAIGPHQETTQAIALDAYVGGIASQNARPSVVDGEAELGGKRQAAIGKRLLQLGGERLCFVAAAPERRHQNIAPGFDLGVGVEQRQLRKTVEQRKMALLLDAPDLEIGPARHINQAIAVPSGELGKPGNLCGFEPPAERAHAHHEPVAREHRAQRAGAPTLDWGRTHEASRSAAAIELRRVCQSAASCRRAKQVSIAARAEGFSRAMKARTSSLPSVAS
ncbi:hypothetical protein ABIG06_005227 [Bradyrhizobium sp. USDA 326]